MLLTITNLPSNVKYGDIKALVYSKCNIQDMILGDLTAVDEYTKKITIGLTGEEDAAVIMRRLNGFHMDGKQLQVIPKSKIPVLNADPQQPFIPPLISPSTSAGFYPSPPNWYMPNQGPQQQQMASQSTPVNILAANLMNYRMNASQTAYYQMNQPAYPTRSTPATEKVGYPPPNSYGNRHNQSNIQNDWSQQQQPGGFSNVQANRNREQRWDSNQESKQRGNAKQNARKDRKTERENNRRPEWGNDNNMQRDADRQSNFNRSRDLKRAPCPEWNYDVRDNDHYANRDSLHTNQIIGPSSHNDSSYVVENIQQNAQSTFSIYGSHVTRSSSSNKQDDRFKQHGGNQPGRTRSPFNRQQSPPAKRSRFSNFNNDKTEPKQRDFSNKKAPKSKGFRSDNSNFKGPGNLEFKRDSSTVLRAELATDYAKMTLKDTCCTFEGVDHTELLTHLKRAFGARIDKKFKNTFISGKKHLVNMYKNSFDMSSHCDLLREAVKKLGGRMITVSKFQPGNKMKQMQNKFTNVAKKRGPANKQQSVPLAQIPGRIPQYPKGANKQQSVPLAQIPGRIPQYPKGANKQQSVPLAQIPGRIPQYPKGDKQAYKRQKKDAENIFNDHGFLVNLMKNMNPAIRLAIGEEMEIIYKVIADACEDSNHEDAVFGANVKRLVPQKMKSVLKVNLARRMIPILPIQVCVFSSPPIKRWLLENFLTTFKVSCLKKFKHRPLYLASCDSVEDHDNLCLMGPVLVGNSTVVFKPFHLAGAREKTKRSDIKKQRKHIRAVAMQHFAKNHDNELEENWDSNDNDCVMVDNAEETQKEDIDVMIKQEELCLEMKELYDRINNPEITKSEHIANIKTEEKVSINEINQYEEVKTGIDFTDDVDIDNFTNNVKTGSDNDLVGNVKIEGENINNELSQLPVEDQNAKENTNDNIIDSTEEELHITEGEDINAVDIDIGDVSEGDLEDW